MTNAATKLQETLSRLNKMTSQKKGSGTGKKINYWKPKQGKNELIVLPFAALGDPFFEWGEHKGLLEPSYLSIPCAQHFDGSPCPICEVVKDLKKADWKGNKEMWAPIETKVRYYSPVVDLANIEAGIQWFSYGKTVLSQFQTWLVNLEEDELPFYSVENPEKIIVNYDKEADAALKYKLDKKTIKKLPEGLDLEELVEGMEDLGALLNQYKRDDNALAQIVDDYLKVFAESLSDDDEEEEKTTETPEVKETSESNDDDDDDDDKDVDDTPKLKSLKKKQ